VCETEPETQRDVERRRRRRGRVEGLD